MNKFVQKLLKRPNKALSEWRRAGDRARDEKDWPRAEEAYGLHLKNVPGDVAIWVQYGHALKEQGKLAAAEQAYRRAVAEGPDSADAHLQLGHLLKRTGRSQEAKALFLKSNELAPRHDVQAELVALGQKPLSVHRGAAADLAAAGAKVLIEIDDFFRYIEHHTTLTGIQRVQLEVIRTVLKTPAPDGRGRQVFVLQPPGDPQLFALQSDDLLEIVEYLDRSSVALSGLRALAAAARERAVPIWPKRGQCYMILGAFWGTADATARYAQLKKEGIVLGAYIYDLIPISHPELCIPGLTNEFSLFFGEGMALFDFVLTISDFTAREVRDFRDRLGLAKLPMETVLLAHVLKDKRPSAAVLWTPAILELRDRDFVLMVSRIELRKNHQYLLKAWRQFLREGLDPPELVFVGSPGWGYASIVEAAEAWDYLDGRLHVLHDLSDQELRTLYDACLFTAFPSFVEGWGLPVGESLTYGKPCVASSSSSLPEVGGEFVDYVDPYNLTDGIEILRKMVFDPQYRKLREAEIRTRFKPRSWFEVGAQVLDATERLSSAVKPTDGIEVLLPEARIFRPGDLAEGNRIPDDYAVSPTRLILTQSWHAHEEWGAWMRDQAGLLRFRADLPERTEIVLYLDIRIAPWAMRENVISVSINGARTVVEAVKSDPRVPLLAERRTILRCFGAIGSQQIVEVELSVAGEIVNPSKDPRRFVIGLIGIGYAAQYDMGKRAEIAEAFLFDRK